MSTGLLPIGERVAALEARVDSVEETQQQILSEVRAIHEEMTKYKGMVGGMAFLVTCLVTAFSLAKDWIVAHLR